MSCRAPSIHKRAYMIPGAAPSLGDDRYPLFDIQEEDPIAAIEIDCSSEVDCAIVTHSGGTVAFVSVGSPAIGPFISPIFVHPWRRVMPYANEVQGFLGEPLLKSPPILALKAHYQMPPVFQSRRAACCRVTPDQATSDVTYSIHGELPLFGFARARLMIINNSSGNSLTYKIEGVQYRARQTITEQSGEPVSSGTTPAKAQLVLDSTGAVERTVASGATDPITLEGEPFDTLLVSTKHPVAATTCRVLYRAEGEL